MKAENLQTTSNKIANPPSQDSSAVNVKITELLLTPFTCATLINEILKGLLYQKCQIPYPYSWLKTVVNKKRQKTENEHVKKRVNFTVTNHFRVASTVYDSLENIMNGITKEFNESENQVKQVVILFGTTPQCPKEVFTINISSITTGHKESNHMAQLNQYQQKILRNIFLSQNWLDNIDTSALCTNTFVYLKKTVSDCSKSKRSSSQNVFIPTRPLTFSSRLIKHIKINLYSENENINCCENLSVYQDISDNQHLKQENFVENENSENCVEWYQSKDLLKGFKDCYVNKVSASELW